MTTIFDVRKYHYPGQIIKDIGRDDLKGANVTLINAPIREQAKPNVAPLGPALLASRLRQFDVNVTIVDLNIYRIVDEEARKRGLPNGRVLNIGEAETLLSDTFNKKGDQDLVGISGLITTLSWQDKIAKIVRELQPQAVIVSGGGLATEFRDILFQWIPELDGIAHSEGDDVIIKMAYDAKNIREMGLKNAASSGKLAPYLVEIKEGRPRFYYDGGRPEDLNSVPFPAWDLLEADVHGFPVLETYIKTSIWGGGANNSSAASFLTNRSLPMISSRGCPFNCRFCFKGAQGERNYGARSADNIIKEMSLNSKKYNLDFIGITDDNFMVGPKRIVDIAENIQPLLRESNIKWGTHGRLDEAADIKPGGDGPCALSIKRVDKMAEAGCVYLGFGGESASSHVLEKMGKGGFTLKNGEVILNGFSFPVTMVEGIKNTLKAGIHANCTWIMGYPGERLEDLKTTVAFIKWQEELYTRGLTPGTPEYEIAYNSVNRSLFVATAYPGTEMFKDPVVQERLFSIFGINFDHDTGEAVPDNNLYNYVLELDDATKVLSSDKGSVYYGDMDNDEFLKAREYVSAGDLDKILEM